MAQDAAPPGLRDSGPLIGRLGERPLVAFDFDGTLTVRDSFTAFLRWRARPLRYALGLARLAPSALAYLIHKDRGRIKAAATCIYLSRVPRERLETEARIFAGETAARLLRPDAQAAWNDWGAKGAWRVIVSASPSFVVAPFAEMLGADDLIATELAYDGQGRASGGFSTPNCRGPEKVVRLIARYGAKVGLAAAYGDTTGDRELLQIADEAGYRVFTGRP
jgi:phosphatidylglycerophosphatase C